MADVTLTPVAVVAQTRTADLVGASASATAGQTFAFACGDARRYLLFMEETNTGAATVTIDAGDYPPADRKGLGSLALSLAQADLRMVVLETARFLQNDGTITGTVATNTVKLYVLILPLTV